MLKRLRGNLFRVFVITLSFGEPGEESLSRLANLLADRKLDILLASLRTPFGDDLFWEKFFIVQDQEDLRSLVVETGVLLAPETDEAFYTSKEGLLMLLRIANHLK